MSKPLLIPARLVLFACLALALLTGPLRAEDEPAAPPATGPAPEAPAAEAAGVPKETSVKLIGNGTEPRTVLRYAPAAGTSLEFTTSTTTEVTSPMGAMTLGPIKVAVRATFSKSENRSTPTATEVVSAELEGDANNPFAGQMKAGIEKTKGTKLAGHVSEQGLWKTEQQSAPLSPDQETMQSQMVTLFFPLPKEAVGVGASWTVTAPITASRVTQTSVITATVTAIQDGRVELSVTEKRSAKNAQMEMMGQKVPITSIEGGGKGTMVLDLGLGGVVAANVKIDTKMVMNMMGNEMENSSSTSTSLSAKAPAAVTRDAETKEAPAK